MIEYVLIGFLTGFSNAIGTYFALKYAIDHLEKTPEIKDKIKNWIK